MAKTNSENLQNVKICRYFHYRVFNHVPMRFPNSYDAIYSISHRDLMERVYRGISSIPLRFLLRNTAYSLFFKKAVVYTF